MEHHHSSSSMHHLGGVQNPQGHHHHLHWNYSSPSTNISATAPLTSTPIVNSSSNSNQTWTPPSTRGLKRAMSESDCDDIYSEESSKEHASSIENDSCQLMSRKKRRGVIEKKRRDRINSSLSELKRLVPSAFEKQGSAKLEKAEILQLTVDHLKMLHAKGIDSMAFDPQRFAMDYHIIGFRECASEVARYLVTIEGMDIQDPLRLRLMSHLQCFVAQRELSAKSSTATMSGTSWNTYQPNYPPTQSYQTYPTTPVTPTTHHHQNSSQHHNSFNSSSSYMPSSSYLGSSHSILPQSPEYSSSSGYGSTQTSNNTSSNTNVNTSSNSASNNSSTSPAPHTVTSTNDSTQENQQQQPIYTDLSNSNDRLQLSLNGNYHYGNANQLYANSGNNNGYNNNNNNSKPYRPWHPEMAY
ncbi:hypothetical protein PVAND_011180 [Polypedilum vanderplanki]|uniref:Hairy/enhancer-of-split related with YRPW motif protein n=1 Tax=Polypedilum vanderplanki TaxID=319348 RepID=A0A9J6CIC1_POLVA|nr:hypothetical protein PVAND_011180 [Polypedilum vanderplanki]